MTNTNANPNDERDRMLEGIAKRALDIPTLRTRKSDSLDFHDVAVWSLLEAMRLAYAAGIEHAIADREAPTAELVSKTKALRVIALDARIRGWLRANDPQALEQVRNVLASGGDADDYEATMPPSGICPRCGEDDHDRLVWDEHGETVTCQRCGTNYTVHQIH